MKFEILVDTSENEDTKSPSDFLKLDMNKKVIKSITIPSLTSDYKYETYKVNITSKNSYHPLVTIISSRLCLEHKTHML